MPFMKRFPGCDQNILAEKTRSGRTVSQRGWHPQPIIASGIRIMSEEKFWNENKVLQYCNTDKHRLLFIISGLSFFFKMESVDKIDNWLYYCNCKEKIMSHPIYRVVSVKVSAPYTLKVEFDDNTLQVIDFQPVLKGELYAPLRDITLFNQVQIDPEVHTLVWPNGADFDPATLHDWSETLTGLTALSQQW
jgi:hypothetical protein